MFNIPKVSPLLKVERYEVNGELKAVFAQSVDETETYCASLPDYEFTGNQLRKFYKYAFAAYGLSKTDFYGRYSECDGCYERTVRGQFVLKRLFNVGSEAHVKAIAEEWEEHL